MKQKNSQTDKKKKKKRKNVMIFLKMKEIALFSIFHENPLTFLFDYYLGMTCVLSQDLKIQLGSVG